MLDATKLLDVPCHAIRKLIRDGILPARQVMFDAPWQITATDLERPKCRARSAAAGRVRAARIAMPATPARS